jgi:hypothetical protein
MQLMTGWQWVWLHLHPQYQRSINNMQLGSRDGNEYGCTCSLSIKVQSATWISLCSLSSIFIFVILDSLFDSYNDKKSQSSIIFQMTQQLSPFFGLNLIHEIKKKIESWDWAQQIRSSTANNIKPNKEEKILILTTAIIDLAANARASLDFGEQHSVKIPCE